MGPFFRDLRHAFRSLRRQPAGGLTALLCLALGIGAATAVFTLVNGTLLRPMPYEEPDRLLFLSNSSRQGDGWAPHSMADLAEWERRQEVFEGIAAFANVSVTMRGNEYARRLTGMGVSRGMFEILGVPPLLGRSFADEEWEEGGPGAVLLTWGVWQREFGGDPGIVGTQTELSGSIHTIVGVMPEGFRFPWWTDVYVPLQIDPAGERAHSRHLRSVARLADGVSLEQARAAMDGVAAALSEEDPEHYAAVGVFSALYHETERGYYSDQLLVLLAAVVLVLLISCVNVASILLARASRRGREVAIRTSLGAGRGDLVRQMLAESLLIALLGTAAGLGLGLLGRDLLLAGAPGPRPYWMDFGLDLRVGGFVVGLSVLTALLFGLAPSLFAVRTSPARLLRSGGERSGEGSGRWGRVLIASEVALALALLVASGAMMRGLGSMLDIETGFDPEGVLTFRVDLPAADYPDPESRGAVLDRLMEEVGALPGVSVAGAVQALPLSGTEWGSYYHVEGAQVPEAGQTPIGNYRIAHGDYFAAAGIPMLAGRGFTRAETEGGGDVVVVNRSLADAHFPGENPVGRRLKLAAADQDRPWLTIVGVAQDVRHRSLTGSDPRPGFYVPSGSRPVSSMTFLLRTPGEETLLADPVREIVARLAPSAPVHSLQTFQSYYDHATGESRFHTQLMGAFSLSALLLALVGVAGVVSFMVSRRMREMGIRTALGASPRQVLARLLGEGMRPVGAGLVGGVLLGYGLLRWLASSFYGIRPAEPTVYLLLAVLLATAALAAVWLPARRVMGADPVRVLREE